MPQSGSQKNEMARSEQEPSLMLHLTRRHDSLPAGTIPHMPPVEFPSLRDPARGNRNLAALAAHLGERFAQLAPALQRLLPRTADPDMALNNLERLFAQPAGREQFSQLLEARGRGLEAVLHL